MLFLPYRKINRIFFSYQCHATKVNLADFKINFMRRLIFTAIKECKIKLITLMALSKHIPEIERQSYTLYREKSVHTLARKRANLNFSAWSLLLLQPTNAKQNEKHRKSV